MKKLFVVFAVTMVCSCSKEPSLKKAEATVSSSTSLSGRSLAELRRRMIDTALVTINPNRITIAQGILLGESTDPKNKVPVEIKATDNETGVVSLGFIIIDPKKLQNGKMLPDWGTYGGWMLGNDGCFYHGSFTWSGTPDNYVFFQDPNPYGDNYSGNEPRCMSWNEFDNLC